MDRIPPEISCDIFLRTLPYPIDPSNPPYKESISSPLRISHVCRTWRKLPLSYGELWAYLCMSYSVFDTQKKREMVVEIFDTWLSRTNGAVLNYVVEFWSPPLAQTPHDVEHIFTMLLRNQHRWKDVAFSCHNAVFSPRFPGFNLTNIPLLTSLKFRSDPSLHLTADFTQSLRLRSLDVHHDTFYLVTDNLSSTLEQIRLSSAEPSEFPRQKEDIRSVHLCLTLLRSNPYLRELHVHSYLLDSPMPPLSHENRIVHSNLDDLRFWTRAGSELPAMIIDAVTIPSLKTLLYVCRTGSETLLRFFQRSTPPLTKLDLGCRDASEETLIGILRLLPTLRNLGLTGMVLSEWFFHQLTVSGGMSHDNSTIGEHIVCPGLSYLSILNPASDDPNTWLKSLLTMTKSRASRLETLNNSLFIGIDGVSRSVDVADIDQYAELIDSTKCLSFRTSRLT